MNIEIDSIPLMVKLPRKKVNRWFRLNMNEYRNAHYMVLAEAKKAFYDEMDRVHGNLYIEVPPPLEFVYYIPNPSFRNFDLSNVGSVVDKFMCDWLIYRGLLKDDSIKTILSVKYIFSKHLLTAKLTISAFVC